MENLANRLTDSIKSLWAKYSNIQKAAFAVISLAFFSGLVSLFFWGGAPAQVAVLGVPIRDESILNQIAVRLDSKNIRYEITNNKIYVDSRRTAQQVRTLLVQEDLMPSGIDPWSIFDVQRWTTTEFENNINLRRAITKSLEQHIMSLEIIGSASITLVMPKKQVFKGLQEPTTASVVLGAKPGIDLQQNKKQIRGIVKLISFGVAGLKQENITILDREGNTLNDFQSMADFDRLALGSKVLRERKLLEAQLARTIHGSLGQIVSADRVEIINVSIDLDYVDRKVNSSEVVPVYKRKDNPETPWDESEVFEAAPISEMTKQEDFEGTNFNPEGPAGQEGQVPPAYKELENTPGKYNSNSQVSNYQWSKIITDEIANPLAIERIAVGIAIDGTWQKVYDGNGNPVIENGQIQRNYLPVPEEDLEKIRALVRDSLNINTTRGDTIRVENIQFDRGLEFAEEDALYQKSKTWQQTWFILGISIISVLGIYILFRLFLVQRERIRRHREEELARQHQAMRQATLQSIEDNMTTSEIDKRKKADMELQENVMNLTLNNPENVAQLLRLWIMDE